MPQQLTKGRTCLTKRYVQKIVVFAVLLGAVMLMPVPDSHAQGITGSIAGTVTDTSGAAVAGATVTIRNLDTNATRSVTTSDIGSYKVTQLQPGRYSVKVEQAGFKSYQTNNLTLQIDQTAMVDARLEIGSEQMTVTVTTSAPVIQAEDSSVGSVIDSKAIQNTPLNGRLSIMGLVALAPGVQGVGAQDQIPVRGLTVAIGTGSRNSYGGVGSTLDGVTNQEVTLQRGEGEVPSLDALSEFKLLTTGAPAEFNQPAQIVVASKSGGNQFHGGAFEYNRSKGTSAKNYFAGALTRPAYQRNEYGGNLSGPIWIPHIYNGKDRSFFFAAYEGFHLTQSLSLNTQQPTTRERAGDFSEFLAGGVCATSTTGTKIVNPSTGTAFSGNQIPSTSISPVSLQLLNLLYPKPTQSGCGTNTSELVSNTSEVTRFSLRLDHKINDKNQIRATFLRAFYGPNPDNEVTSLQGGFSGDGEHNTNTILGWTHIFSPTLILDVYGSYFHLPIYRTPQNSKVDFASIIPGVGAQGIEGAPQITITNITNVAEQGSKDLEQVIQGNSALTKILPKHAIKAGFSYLWDNHWNDSAQSPQRGSYIFNGHYSGIAFADFLLGDPSTTGNATPTHYTVKNLSSQYGMYVQDDWKPASKLTLNMGVRYDLQWFEDNPYGNNSLYIPSLQKVVVFGKSYPASALSHYLTSIPITLSANAGLGSNVWDYLGQAKKNFAPRFGFAYEALPNTVVRGAFGIYFNLLPASYVGNAFGTLPFVGSVTYTNSSGTTPSFTMSNPFSATGAYGANPSVAAQHTTVTPYTEEYNLAIEHQLPGGVGVRLGYVGQHNVKQNNASGSGNTAPNINLANPPVVGSTVQSTNLVQPFNQISLNLDPIFHSTMNSLQIGAHKQYSHGFMINAEYQWTRVLGTENIENPSGATPNDSYGPVSGITPQVLTVNYSYALPFGKGQSFLGTAHGLVDKLVGGWQWSGVSTFQTGQPFNVTYTAPGSPVGLVSGRANRVQGVALYPAHKTLAQWFNPAAFAAPPTYTSGGVTYATYGNSGYDMLRGPRWQNWDMNLQKHIPIKERYEIQLRADSFNVFNHSNFAVPNSAISNTSTVGKITSTSSSPNLYEPRTLEFAAKFTF